jgi:hypothetical protein
MPTALKRIKRETVFIDLPIGSNFDVSTEVNYEQNKDYKNIIGVWAKPSGISNFLGLDFHLRDTAGMLLIDPSDSELWRGGSGLKPEDMFVPILVRIGGGIMKFGVTPRGAAVSLAAIKIECVFLLSDELIEIANPNT